MGLDVWFDISYPWAPHTLVHAVVVREFDHTAGLLITTQGDDKRLLTCSRKELLGHF